MPNYVITLLIPIALLGLAGSATAGVDFDIASPARTATNLGRVYVDITLWNRGNADIRSCLTLEELASSRTSCFAVGVHFARTNEDIARRATTRPGRRPSMDFHGGIPMLMRLHQGVPHTVTLALPSPSGTDAILFLYVLSNEFGRLTWSTRSLSVAATKEVSKIPVRRLVPRGLVVAWGATVAAAALIAMHGWRNR